MSISFKLFSFNFFEALRRNNDRDEHVEATGAPSPSQTSVGEEAEERERQQAADYRFWGLGYFPIL